MQIDMTQIITIIISAVFGSAGMWAFISAWAERKSTKRSAEEKLLLGLACDRIVHLGMTYIERGWITKDEYETLHDYLWLPYKDCGGDGTAERVMNAVDKLEIRY